MAIQEIHIQEKQPTLVPIEGTSAAAFTARVFRLEGITPQQAELLRKQLLADPVTETSTVNEQSPQNAKSTSLEVGYKPGVMDPAEASVMEAAQNLGITPQAVSTSTIYTFKETLSDPELQKITASLVSQVQHVITTPPETLSLDAAAGPVETVAVIDKSAAELQQLSKTRSLFLNETEMQVIQSYFQNARREPTDVELETLAQTWSEHCVHKTFKAVLIDEHGKRHQSLMEMLKTRSEKHMDRVEVASAFADNAGGILFYEDYVIVIKGETHNSPVAVEPYGGSLTKVGGDIRDIAGFGKGAENVVIFVTNCFADPHTPVEALPHGVLPPQFLLLENSRGERDYGNRMGIPTHHISLHFHPDFGPKPTSMGIAVGIIPEKYVQKEIPQPGDLLLTVGGKTGRDGIHGATFSSGAMTSETSTVHSTAVQIGNAIEEKRMFDALIACRDAGLIRSITDCGAGGYSSAVGEMGKDTGVTMQLEKVPLKYQGLSPWEIWISESQERMVVAIAPKHWQQFKQICDTYAAPVDVIGSFTNTQELALTYNGTTVGNLSMEFLHHGLPRREMRMRYAKRPETSSVPEQPTNWQQTLFSVLGHLNLASTEPMLRQYDQTVQGRLALAPFTGVNDDCPTDASILAPLRGKPYGIVTAQAVNPVLNSIDPYWGSVWSVTHALSRFVAVGGDIDHAAMNDNFVSPFPDEESLGDLYQSVRGLCDMMDVFQVPCISGKDSLSSTFHTKEGKTIKIPPVLNITVFGKIPDVRKTVSPDLKSSHSVLYLIGDQDRDHLGGSVYFQTRGVQNTQIPHVNIHRVSTVLHRMHDAILSDRVLSCKAIGEGGLATAITQMCIGGDCGAFIDTHAAGSRRPDFDLFNETPGCFVVEVASMADADQLFAGLPRTMIGHTFPEKNIIVGNGIPNMLSVELAAARQAWQKPLQEVLDVT